MGIIQSIDPRLLVPTKLVVDPDDPRDDLAKIVRYVIHDGDYSQSDLNALQLMQRGDDFLIMDGHYRAMARRILDKPVHARIAQVEDFTEPRFYFVEHGHLEGEYDATKRMLARRRGDPRILARAPLRLDDFMEEHAFMRYITAARSSRRDTRRQIAMDPHAAPADASGIGAESDRAVDDAMRTIYAYFKRVKAR